MSLKTAVTEDWIYRRIFGATSNLLPGAPSVVRSSNRHLKRFTELPFDLPAARKRYFAASILGDIATKGELNTQPHPFAVERAPRSQALAPAPALNVPSVTPEEILHHAANGPALQYGEAQLPSVLGPRAKRLLLAIATLPPLAYGAHRAYQHFQGPAPEEEAVKEAALRRYGFQKEALSPMARNMLIGAEVGGTLTGGANYYHHRDEPDAFSRAAKATGAGALAGAIAGGVLTPERSGASTAPRPSAAPQDAVSRVYLTAPPAPRGGGHPEDLRDKMKALADEARAANDSHLREHATNDALNKAKALLQEPNGLPGMRDDLDEFDRLMRDPNHVFQF